MTPQDFKLPKTLAEFSSPRFRAELVRAEKLLNALQNLKVQITVSGTTTNAVGNIQIVGETAIVVVNL